MLVTVSTLHCSLCKKCCREPEIRSSSIGSPNASLDGYGRPSCHRSIRIFGKMYNIRRKKKMYLFGTILKLVCKAREKCLEYAISPVILSKIFLTSVHCISVPVFVSDGELGM